jgi:hypothetical protein
MASRIAERGSHRMPKVLPPGQKKKEPVSASLDAKLKDWIKRKEFSIEFGTQTRVVEIAVRLLRRRLGDGEDDSEIERFVDSMKKK